MRPDLPIRLEEKVGHTPGPWLLGCDLERVITDYRDGAGNSTKDNYARNGLVKSICRLSHGSFADISEHVANGKLIAASPEFAAGIEMMITHEEGGGDGWWRGWQMLKAAYRKAGLDHPAPWFQRESKR